MGELVTRVSVWIALLCYLAGPLAALAGRAAGSRRLNRWRRRARFVYSCGFVAFMVHVVAAFHVFYEWSHSVALAETARQTAELTGARSGAGLWLNYLYLLVWALDVAWWWRVDVIVHARRRAWATALIHGFFVFIAFNATVVFEQGPVRWIGAAATALLFAVAFVVALRSRTGPSAPG
ncbi:MAG: hypothetical protein AAGC60_23780 [Acidobacteriota bacterium]